MDIFRSPKDTLYQLHVLLFNEDRKQLKHYLNVLRVCGMRDIMLADKLTDALNFIISDTVDLIVTAHFGDAPGVTRLLEEVKSLDATATIPVVAVVADNNVRNALQVLAKGVDEILVEPLSRHLVEAVVAKLINVHSDLDPVREKLNTASALFAKGKNDEAERVYLEIQTMNDPPLEAHVGLGRLYVQAQKWGEADAAMRKALESAKASQDRIEAHRQLAEVFYEYGSMYEQRKRLEQAIKSYQTSLSLNPFYLQSFKSLLRLLQKRDDLTGIIALIKDAAGNFIPYSRALEEIAGFVHEVANRYTRMNLPGQARKVYEQLLVLKHDETDIHLKVADFFTGIGQVGIVLRSLLVVAERIKDPDLSTRIGSLLLEGERRFMVGGKVDISKGADLGFFESLSSEEVIRMAHKSFQEAYLLDPDNPNIRLSLAGCHLRSKDMESALEILNKVFEEHGNDLNVLAMLVETLIEEQAHDAAEPYLKDILTRFPEDPRFYALQARLFQVREQHYDAVGCLKKGLTICPDHAPFVVRLAEIYEDLKQYSDAVVYYEKAMKLLPHQKDLQEGLHRALSAKYDRDKAGK